MPVTKPKEKKLSPAKASALLDKRWSEALSRISPESLARGHKYHLRIYTSVATNIILYCSRRAGKTEVILGLLLLTSIASAGVASLYLGLTKSPVRDVYKRWKKLLGKNGLDVPCMHAEVDGNFVTEFHNGSRVVFGSTDDRAHIQTYLGNSMAGALCAIDESQSQAAVLRELAIEIVGPMLDEVTPEHPTPGRLIIAGTAEDSAGSFFDSAFADNSILDGEGRLVGNKPDSEWECYQFSRFDNPGELQNENRLAAFCKKWNLSPTDPLVLQAWYGLRVFDANATCYRYSVERNRYTAPQAPWSGALELAPGKLTAVIPKSGIDTFACGIDAGSHDRTGIVLWGWSSKHLVPGVWQVAEWSTERHTPIVTSQVYAVLKVFKHHYGRVIKWIRDDGSSQTIDDTLYHEHGILLEPPIKAKGSKRSRVERLADLLQTDRAHILAGSELETDLMLCKWDHIKRTEGKWLFDDAIIHPDIADAGTYGIAPFLELPKKDTPTYATEAEKIQAETLAAFHKSLNTKPLRRDKPRPSSSLWGNMPK